MGRNSTGIITTAEVKRLELSYLLKMGYICKGKAVTGARLSWIRRGEHPYGDITIDSLYTDQEKYLRLRYTITREDGTREPYDYKIYLNAKPSNLGRGEVLYFICPERLELCRVLYMAYSSPTFKSREAYSVKLYYPLQTSSQLSRFNDRFWSLERSLGKLQQGRPSYSYSGKVTRRRDRIERLQAKQDKADILRFTEGMPKSLARKINIETPVGVGIWADKSKQNKQSKL
jgi:hypothetical protein